jgi:hypothetical protein
MDLTGAILLAAICLVIGFLLGVLINSLRGKADQQMQSQEGASPESKDGLRIWQQSKDGSLGIELDGLTFTQPRDLTADQLQRVNHLVSNFQAWLSIAPESPPPSTQVQPEALSGPAAPTSEELDRTSLNPFQIFTQSWQAGGKGSSQEPEKSIVSQIDEILQAKLKGTPLDKKGIRLIEDPDLGMVVEIGLQRFDDVDSVPEVEIRQLIRQSVAEWESKMGE